jgi:hypothetical protein
MGQGKVDHTGYTDKSGDSEQKVRAVREVYFSSTFPLLFLSSIVEKFHSGKVVNSSPRPAPVPPARYRIAVPGA